MCTYIRISMYTVSTVPHCRANMESETRVESKRIVRCMQRESVERDIEEKLQAAKREKEYSEKQKMQEEKLVKVCAIQQQTLVT